MVAQLACLDLAAAEILAGPPERTLILLSQGTTVRKKSFFAGAARSGSSWL
ncbi:MAG: hypothetical protein ACR2ND_07150 [Solirubrobacteraceae bacterium]